MIAGRGKERWDGKEREEALDKNPREVS